jgi:hypothetical protein
MLSFHVAAMMLASGPDFMEQEAFGWLDGAVKIIGDAAFLSSGGRDEGTKFRFEERFLARFGAQEYNQSHGILGELGSRPGCAVLTSGPTCGRSLGSFWLRHGGAIVLQSSCL